MVGLNRSQMAEGQKSCHHRLRCNVEGRAASQVMNSWEAPALHWYAWQSSISRSVPALGPFMHALEEDIGN